MEAAASGTKSSQNTPLQECQREVEALRTALVVAREQAKVAEARVQGLETANQASQQRDRLLEATVTAANALSTIANFDEAVNTALQILGESLETARIAILENFDHPTDASFRHWRSLYNWTSSQTVAQVAHPEAGQGSYASIRERYTRIEQGQSLSYSIEDAPEPFRSGQIAIGVKVTHAVPISVAGQFWGVLGLDDCREAKQRSAAELSVLKIAADCIGSAIQRERNQQALLQAEQARSQELERHNAELQQTLDRLAVSETHYRTLFELSNEGIYRFELEQPIDISLPLEEQFEQACQQFQISEVNCAFVNQYGFSSSDDVIACKFTDFYPENPEVGLQAIRTFLVNGYQMYNIETEEVGANGQPLYFLQNGVAEIRNGYLIGGWGVQTDITELRETQQALLQAEQARVAELSQVNAALAQANEEILGREREKSVLLSISEALSRTSDRQALLHVIYQNIQQIFPFYGAGLFIINESKNYHELLLEPGLLKHIPLEFHGTTERLAHRGSVVEYMTQDYGILSLAEASERFPGHPHYPVLQRAGIQEFIHGPLFSGEQCIGMMYFNAQAEGCYSEKDLRLFKHIADQVAVTVANILAKEEIVEREREKAILLEITQVIAQITNTQTLFEVIYSHIQPIFHFDSATVVVLEDDAKAYRVLYHENGPSFDQFFADRIQLAGTPFEVAFSPAIADIYPADVDEWLIRYPNYKGLQLTKQAGYQQILLGKLYNGGKLLGVVELLYQQPPVLDETFHKLFENFVQQVAIAVANILAHQKIITQQAALLRAEQERVTELAKTNAALKNSLDRLAANPDLNAFLGYVLLEIVEQFQVELGYLMLYDAESQTLPLHLYIKQGQVQLQPELEIPAAFLEPAIADLPIWETLLQTRHPFVITRENSAQYVFRGTYDWQVQNQEHRTGINLLLTLKDEPIGLLALVSTRRSFSPEELELAQALAHQATLALQLTRLAEEAKQAAIAREQEKAAQERAAELAKANGTLRRSLSWLAHEGNLNQFLERVLLEIAATTQANLAYLFVLHEPERMLELTARVINGELSRHPSPTEPAIFSAPFSADITPAFHLMEEQNLFFTLDMAMLQPELTAIVWPDTIEWHLREGRRQVASLVLKAGDRSVGFLGLGFREQREFSQEERELVIALANQASLAILLIRLAEEAKQAAIAREQEKAAQERAAELAKANAVLRRTASQLVGQQDLDHFLNSLLLEITQEVGAVNNSIFLCARTADSYRMHYSVQDGQIVNLETDPRFEFWQTPTLADNEGWKLIQARGYMWSVLDTDAIQYDELCDWTIEWHRQMQHRAVMCFLLQMGDKPLGFMGLCFREAIEPSADRISFIQTLANQAALAIQLTRLAEEAKQAAIAREQEKAAQERVAELAKANEALKGTTDRLANEPSLSAFLGHVVSEACRQVDCDAGAIFLYEQSSEQLALTVGVGIEEYPYTEQILLPTAKYPGWSVIIQSRKPLFFHPDVNPEMYAEGSLDWHRAQGHHGILATAMMLGDRPLGQIAVAFRHKHNFKETDLELFQALAQQATLAVQLMHLADEAKQAVILEERNRMARDIHDTLAQSFTGIIMQLEATKNLTHPDCSNLQISLDCIGELARLGLAEARRSVRALRLEALETADFPTALRRLLHQSTNATSIRATLAIEGTARPLSPVVEENLLRIAQEAITNAIRHGHAQTIALQLLFEPATIHLQISDDGSGFNPRSTPLSGFGLLGMQERTEQLKGQFHLVSQPEQGTEITVSVPL